METKPCLVELEHFTTSSSVCSDDNILQSINTVHNSADNCLSNSNHDLPDVSSLNISSDYKLQHNHHSHNDDSHHHHIHINSIYVKLLSKNTINTINNLIINLGKIKIIAIQSCNSLRTKTYRNISKIKLINLLTLIQNQIQIIKTDLETLVSESVLETLTFEYLDLFSDISIKNYIEIIRIIDLTFYNLYSILRNIKECS